MSGTGRPRGNFPGPNPRVDATDEPRRGILPDQEWIYRQIAETKKVAEDALDVQIELKEIAGEQLTVLKEIRDRLAPDAPPPGATVG